MSKIIININDPSWKSKYQKYALLTNSFIVFDKTARKIRQWRLLN